MADQRTCMKCQSAQEAITIMGVEIDRCVNCGGIWLDGGELKALADKQTTSGSEAQLEAAIARLAKAPPTGGASPMAADVVMIPCPACAGKLTVAYGAEVSIEQCNACDGVFLDKGELAKAIELVDTDEATTIMALARSVTTAGVVG